MGLCHTQLCGAAWWHCKVSIELPSPPRISSLLRSGEGKDLQTLQDVCLLIIIALPEVQRVRKHEKGNRQGRIPGISTLAIAKQTSNKKENIRMAAPALQAQNTH
eukprot:388189-Pelagomonas_calceolata.AAC.4